MKILIAEDEKDLRGLLKQSLEAEGYTVLCAKDGLEAFDIFRNNEIDLGLFDIMMPFLDGLNLLRKIRESSTIPVIFLTAKGEEMDKVIGLGLGADDYLVKPFGMAELLARVAANLRRNMQYSKPEKPTMLSIGELTLDINACNVIKAGQIMELNAKEFLLLKFFMENPAKVFTKKQLYTAVWQEDYLYDDNTVMVHISRIRNKIETDPQNPVYIKTVKGIGYKFNKEA